MTASSEFAARVREALAKYEAYIFWGVSHDGAHKLSGLLEAVTKSDEDSTRGGTRGNP